MKKVGALSAIEMISRVVGLCRGSTRRAACARTGTALRPDRGDDHPPMPMP